MTIALFRREPIGWLLIHQLHKDAPEWDKLDRYNIETLLMTGDEYIIIGDAMYAIVERPA